MAAVRPPGAVAVIIGQEVGDAARHTACRFRRHYCIDGVSGSAPCHSAAKTLDALASDRELPRCGAGPNDNVAAHGSREPFNAGDRR